MRRIGLLLLVLTPLAIFAAWLAWYLTPARPLNLLILDKTVVNEQANEERGLSWLLQHERYVPPVGTYKPGEMSVGFRPMGDGRYQITGFELRDSSELVRLASTYDAAYVADTYGIFEITWYAEYPSLGPVTQPGRKIYGGMHRNDLSVLRAMESDGKLIIAEFSCFGPPTPPDIRKEMEELFGVRWSGWTGRSYQTLDSTGTDLPDWVVRNFMRQSGGSWPFGDAPGLVLSHVDERIVVLRYPEDLEKLTPEIAATFDARDRLGAPPYPLPYSFWFDIVQPDTMMETVAYMTLHTTQLADTLLRAFGIPRIFPAVLERQSDRRMYYFAGDFADNPDANELLAHFKGSRTLRTALYSIDDPFSRSEFYWNFYYPMVRSILRTAR